MFDVYKLIDKDVIASWGDELISTIEAKHYSIPTDGLEKASINDCRNDLAINPNGYGGKFNVQEGIFKFDFKSRDYIKCE